MWALWSCLASLGAAERILAAVEPDGSIHPSLVEANLRVVSLVDQPKQFGALVERKLQALEKKQHALSTQEQTAQRAVLAFGALLEHLRAERKQSQLKQALADPMDQLDAAMAAAEKRQYNRENVTKADAPLGPDGQPGHWWTGNEPSWGEYISKAWETPPGPWLAMKTVPEPPPEFHVYLDDPPEKRWESLKPLLLKVKAKWSKLDKHGQPLKGDKEHRSLIDVIMEQLGLPVEVTLGQVADAIGGPLLETVSGFAGVSDMTGRNLVEFLSQRVNCYSFNPFCSEMKVELAGIAGLIDETPQGLEALNLAYELTAGCTTVIAEDENGVPGHARSMDFEGHRVLRDLTVTVHYHKTRNDPPFATEAKLAGTTGTLSGVGRGFSLSVNQRMTAGWFVASWLSSVTGGMPLMYAVRKALMACEDFSCAAQYVQGVQLNAPVYLGVAGTEAGEGAIFLRDRASSTCVGLAKLSDEYGCTSAPDGWLLAVANDDEVNEKPSEADLQEYGRRAMAVQAVKSGAFTENNRAGAANMLRALRWAFVSRHDTIYRCHATPKTGTLVTEVQDDTGGVNPVWYDFIQSVANFENVQDLGTSEWMAGSTCQHWDEWQQCGRSMAARREQLAAQYVGKQGGHPVTMEEAISCPCAADKGQAWNKAAGLV